MIAIRMPSAWTIQRPTSACVVKASWTCRPTRKLPLADIVFHVKTFQLKIHQKFIKILFEKYFQVINECKGRSHDCDPNAECLDLPRGYACRCKTGYLDVSNVFKKEAGRKCALGCSIQNDFSC